MIQKMLFGSRSLDLLKGGLGAGSARMRAIAENLANVTTPGYQAKRVEFEELVTAARQRLALERSAPQHLAAQSGSDAVARPVVKASPDPVAPGAVNNVELEQELVRLKENEIHFQALSQLLARRYKGIENAIRKG